MCGRREVVDIFGRPEQCLAVFGWELGGTGLELGSVLYSVRHSLALMFDRINNTRASSACTNLFCFSTRIWSALRALICFSAVLT